MKLLTTGKVSNIAKGLGSVEGLHIVSKLDNGVIIKTVSDNYYTLSYSTYESLIKKTKDIPSKDIDLDHLLNLAGCQKVPSDISAIFDKLLIEDASQEQFQDYIINNSIDFFNKEVPNDFVNYDGTPTAS
jgi:hypothetical protein